MCDPSAKLHYSVNLRQQGLTFVLRYFTLNISLNSDFLRGILEDAFG